MYIFYLRLIFIRILSHGNFHSKKTGQNPVFSFGGELSPLYELRKSDIGAASLD